MWIRRKTAKNNKCRGENRRSTGKAHQVSQRRDKSPPGGGRIEPPRQVAPCGLLAYQWKAPTGGSTEPTEAENFGHEVNHA